MKELFDKLSSYSIFSNLFCGAVFAVLADKFLNYSLVQQNIVTGVFFYYFIGLIISKTGSLIVDPFLRVAGNQDLMTSAEKDERIGVLLKVSDGYRSLCALFLLLLFLKFYETLCVSLPSLAEWSSLLLTVFFLLLFLVFYKKQMSEITKKAETNK